MKNLNTLGDFTVIKKTELRVIIGGRLSQMVDSSCTATCGDNSTKTCSGDVCNASDGKGCSSYEESTGTLTVETC